MRIITIIESVNWIVIKSYMPPIQIIDKNMGKIYLTNIFHLESILISLLWEFNELMRFSTLNI